MRVSTNISLQLDLTNWAVPLALEISKYGWWVQILCFAVVVSKDKKEQAASGEAKADA